MPSAAGQSGYSCRRTTAGVSGCGSTACPVGEAITDRRGPEPLSPRGRGPAPRRRRRDPARSSSSIATDAPLLPHQCERLAQRAGLGIARMGGTGSHSSGDLFICFATGNRGLPHTTFASDPRLAVDVRIGQRSRHRRAVRRRHRGDRGGDPQRARRRPDHDRPGRHHRPCAAPRSPPRGHGPVRSRAAIGHDRPGDDATRSDHPARDR